MAAENLEVFRCQHCGLLVEVLKSGATPVCCGEPMQLQALKSMDAGVEKHLPVVEATAQGIKVSVGSVPHPMTPEHFIEWIEVINGEYVNRKQLKPGDAPVAEFYVPMQPGLKVRAYCNIHGLWGK